MIPIEDLTDVTLAIDDTDEIDQVMKNIKRWKLSSGESYQSFLNVSLIKWWKVCIKWWRVPSDESDETMKVIKQWKLSNDKSY